jgi:hypothetical protein
MRDEFTDCLFRHQWQGCVIHLSGVKCALLIGTAPGHCSESTCRLFVALDRPRIIEPKWIELTELTVLPQWTKGGSRRSINHSGVNLDIFLIGDASR